jgi:hypothetical protein
MRTTVTLDPDVQVLLKRAMRKHDVSFKQALNDAVRGALTRAAATSPASAWEPPTFELGPLLVPAQSLNQLADELEAQEQIAKLRRGA